MVNPLIPSQPDKELLADGSLWIGKKPTSYRKSAPKESDNLIDRLEASELNELMEYLSRLCEADYDAYTKKFVADAKALKQLGLNITSRGQMSADGDSLSGGSSFPAAFLQTFIDTSVNLNRALYPLNGIVDTRIYGPETDQTLAISERKRRGTNYYLNEKYTDYRNIGEVTTNWSIITGFCAKKITTHYQTGMPTVRCIEPSHFILPPEASSIHDAERILEIIEVSDLEWRRLKENGYLRNVDIQPNLYARFSDAQMLEREQISITGVEREDRHDLVKRYSFFQVQLKWYFKSLGDRSALDAKSYIITFEPVTRQCVRVEENFDSSDPNFFPHQRYVGYKFFPGFSGLGLGLLHLGGNLCHFSTQLHDLLLTSGKLATNPAGIISSALGLDAKSMTLKTGEWLKVPALPPLDDYMKVIFGNEPSPTLKEMYTATEEAIRGLTTISTSQLADISAQQGQSVALTLINMLMQRPNAILERYYQSLSEELSLINDQIYANWNDQTSTQLGSSIFVADPIEREDFSPIPISRGEGEEEAFVVNLIPATGTGMKNSTYRLLQADMVVQMATQAPDIHNLRTVYEEMYKLLEFSPDMIRKILPPPHEEQPLPPPCDPLTENQRLISGQPVQPYPFQDQQAYIAVNSLVLQYPDENVQAAAQALISQREGLWLLQKFQQASGIAVPENVEELSPEEQNSLAIQAAQLIEQGVLTAPWMPPPSQEQPQIDPATIALEEIQVQSQLGQAKNEIEITKLNQQQLEKDRQFELDNRKLALEENKVLSQQLMDEAKLNFNNQLQMIKVQMDQERIEAESLRTLVKDLQSQIEELRATQTPLADPSVPSFN